MKRVSEPNNSWAVIAAPRTKNRTVEISRSKVRSTNAMHLHYHNFNAFCSINDIVKRLLLFFRLFRRNRRWIHSRRLQRAFLPTTHTHTHTPIYIVVVWILIAKLPIWMVLHKSADWFRHLCLSQGFKFFTSSLSLPRLPLFCPDSLLPQKFRILC